MCALQDTAPSTAATVAQIIHPKGATLGLLSSSTPPTFTSFQVQQSNSIERLTNRLSFTLRANLAHLLPETLSISISGLTSTLTQRTSEFSILKSDKIVDTVECVGGLKCHQKVSFACRESKCGKLHRATLDVKIYCTDFDAPDLSKFIEYIRVCQTPSTGNSQCPEDSSYYHEIDRNFYSRGPWQGCTGCSSSTRQVLKDYDITDLVLLYGNELTVEIGASRGVSKLHCYDSYPYIRSIRAALTFERVHSVQTAVWTGQKGRLIFKPNAVIMKCSLTDAYRSVPCLPELKFDIEIQNPAGKHPGSMIKAEADGAGIQFAPISFGPILVTTADSISVIEATLQEVTRVQGNATNARGLNRLNLYVRFSKPLPAGTTITLTGLTGSLSPPASCKPALLPDCKTLNDCMFSSSDVGCQRGLALLDFRLGSALSGSWEQSTGTIIFMVQASFQNKDTFFVSFSLLNPDAKQPPPIVYISASGPKVAVVPHVVRSAVFQGDEEEREQVSINPVVLAANLEESNKIETQLNNVTIRFTTNTFLTEDTIITLSGLSALGMSPDKTGNKENYLWYGDSLERVQSVIVVSNYAMPVAQWQADSSKSSDLGAWFCDARDSGWSESENALWGIGVEHSARQTNLTSQSWCKKQAAQTILLRLRRCVEAGTEISFSFTVPNGFVSQSVNSEGIPHIAASGGSVLIPPVPLVPQVLKKSIAVDCKGAKLCTSQIIQSPSCFDPECRFLKPAAVLTHASLSLDVTCTDFEMLGRFVERVGICIPPKCAEWKGNQCCDAEGRCEAYFCTSTLPSEAYDKGPWNGCARKCGASRRILHEFDVMSLICGTTKPCLNPNSLFVVVVASIFVTDDFCGTNVLDVAVNLDTVYTYERSLAITERGRIISFSTQEDTNTTLSLSFISASMIVSSTIEKGTNVTIRKLLGASTLSTLKMRIENVICIELIASHHLVCNPSNLKVFSSTASWEKEGGTLCLNFIETVAANNRVSFRFVLQNAPTSQVTKVQPELTISSRLYEMGPRKSFLSLLTSSTPPAFKEGALALQSSDMQGALNNITVFFSLNFALPKFSVVELSGLTGSGTRDTDALQVVTEIEISKITWTQSTGTALITVSQDVMSNTLLKFRLTLQNPAFPQTPRTVQVNVPEPALPVQNFATTHALKQISSKVTGKVLSGDKFQRFEHAVVLEGNSMARQWNEMQTSFRPNSALPFASRVIITGLQGAQNPDSLFFPITIKSPACKTSSVGSSAEWFRGSGTLTFIMPCHIFSNTPVHIFFALQNPNSTRSKQSTFISASGPGAHFVWTPMVGSVLGPEDFPRFIIASVAESSRAPGKNMVMLLVMKANVAIQLGSVISITGLVDSLVSSNAGIVLESSTSESKEGPGLALNCTFVKGTLEVVANFTIAKGKHIRVLIHLQSPHKPQPSKVLVVQVKREPVSDEIDTISPQAMSGAALSATVSGRFLSASLFESSTVQVPAYVSNTKFLRNI
jgi:hypothetical protein